MNNIMGPPVEGADFYGRSKESMFAWKMIEKGNNLQLSAPRRVGKTSFALHLLAMAKSQGWHTISINLEKTSTEYQFVEIFVDHLRQLSSWSKLKDKGSKFLEFFGQIKPTLSYHEAKLEFTWESKKQDVYKQLANLLDHEENMLIFFDEITVPLTNIMQSGEEGKARVKSLLHWLREIRITAGSRIRWVHCSSVGIENFTHNHGISETLNDVHKFKIQSFSKAETVAMLKALGQSNQLPLTEAMATAIATQLDYCVPFFVQIFFGKILYLVEVENMPLDEHIVETAYTALIGEGHFNTWIERINDQYGADAIYAFLLLKHICQSKKGEKREILIAILIKAGLEIAQAEATCSRLLHMLQVDGYLLEEDGSYRFRSPLLRDFWFNRFVK